MSIPEELEGILCASPEIMHGEVCFAGTHVPLWVLKEYILNEVSLSEFYLGFPEVSPEMVEKYLFWERAQSNN